MGCVGEKAKLQAPKDVKQTTNQTHSGESPKKTKMTPEEVYEKRRNLHTSLAEGHSHPPAPTYPKMPPVSTIQQ